MCVILVKRLFIEVMKSIVMQTLSVTAGVWRVSVVLMNQAKIVNIVCLKKGLFSALYYCKRITGV